MPSFSKPKSVRKIDLAEWYYPNAAGAAGFFSPAAGNDAQIALFNNSVGAWLYVYALDSVIQVQEFFYYYAIQGTGSLTLSGTAFPVVCDGPVPFGQIFVGQTPSLARGLGNTLPIVGQFQSPLGTSPVGPLAVIKPGYSLVCQTANDLTISFKYLVLGP